MEELPDRIGINPRAMAGKPVTRGTGITVDSILELLAAGMRPEEMAGNYKISIEDARAAMLYAAKVLGRERELIDPETIRLFKYSKSFRNFETPHSRIPSTMEWQVLVRALEEGGKPQSPTPRARGRVKSRSRPRCGGVRGA